MADNQNSSSFQFQFLENLSTRKQHIFALVVLLALPIILFDGATVGGERYIGHDTVQWRAGAETVIDYRQQTGDEALWANNMFSGMPAYVISFNKAVYHIDILLRRGLNSIFPAPFFWVLLIGAYLFFVIQGIRPFSATIGSIIIGFTTYIPIIIGAGHNNKFIAFAFIPWVLLGYWMITRSDKKLLSFFVFVTALILEFRAHHPQVTYYFIYLLAIWWLYDTYRAYQKDQLARWVKRTGLIALSTVVAVLGNLQPFWSLYEYSQYTIRGGSALEGSSGLNLEYAFSWSQGPGELLTLLIPGLYGGASAEAYWGLKPGTSGPHYFGAIASLLAFLGIFLYKKRLKYVFLGTGILTMLFSLGHHFSLLNEFMFRFVPLFNKFRTPEMWLIVTVICFAVLAVYGLDALIDWVQENKTSDLKALYIPIGTALFIGILFAFGSNALLSYENQQQRDYIEQQIASQYNLSPDSRQVERAATQYINSNLKPQRKEMAKSDSIRYLVLVILAGGLIYLFYKRKFGPGLLLVGLLLLTAYDMISIGERYTNEQSLVREDISPGEYVERQKGPIEDYIDQNIDNSEGYPYRAFHLDNNPFNNATPAAYYYPIIGGYTGAKLSYYQDMIENALNAGPRGLNMELMQMLNVKFITARRELPFAELEQVHQQENRRVYRNNGVLPKAFFVDSVTYADSPSAAIDMLNPQNGFDASEIAILETDDSVTAQSDTSASVTVTQYEPRRIELELSTAKPGFLVLSEIYYPEGWKAFVDGRETTIYKTNYVLRGIEVPEGEHTVTFTFNPVSHIWGSRITWGANIFVWGIGLFILIGYIRSTASNTED